MATVQAERSAPEAGQVGLKANAIGFRVTGSALKRASEEGVRAEVALVPLRPAPAILQVAEQRDAHMIVIGTHGESPLKGAILGSTPHKLLHLSDRPVVVVPIGGGAPNGG